jgi:hypothetical protein
MLLPIGYAHDEVGLEPCTKRRREEERERGEEGTAAFDNTRA